MSLFSYYFLINTCNALLLLLTLLISLLFNILFLLNLFIIYKLIFQLLIYYFNNIFILF
jgi:hypothetical protein